MLLLTLLRLDSEPEKLVKLLHELESWSGSESIKEVTAVMVLRASIDNDEEHLELNSEAAEAAAASRGKESDEVM